METNPLASRYRQLQRATVARSALDVIAHIFIACGIAFWGVAFWQLLSPPALLSLLSIQAVVLALVFSLAAPLLLSMLVPTTPAGQLLQKTQWRTLGFPVIIACAAFLTYQSEQLIETWLASQPAIREVGWSLRLAVALTIAFVVIPALAWVQVSPQLFLQQIKQAHDVRKLELSQSGELAIIKARLLWAKQRAAIDYANLLPMEQQEVHDTIRALFMSIGDTQRSIAGTLGISADIEREMMDDTAIADHFDHMASALAAREVNVPALATHVDSRLEPSEPPRAATPTRPQATPRDAAYLRAARDAFGRRPWTLKHLAAELQIGDTSAGELRNAWLDQKECRQVNLGRWSFDISEVA